MLSILNSSGKIIRIPADEDNEDVSCKSNVYVVLAPAVVSSAEIAFTNRSPPTLA